jgi:alkanesulfonate monooxygenase SsuD/methylene tetrahydromethanopterin reductase-like flavin-dependent oxidoreductase (luciferase family)
MRNQAEGDARMRFGLNLPNYSSLGHLHGDPAAIVQQVERYAAAGVGHLIIEPVSSDLDDFLDQITRFALDVVAPTGTQPAHATEVPS